jgi:hypothetical protein
MRSSWQTWDHDLIGNHSKRQYFSAQRLAKVFDEVCGGFQAH